MQIKKSFYFFLLLTCLLFSYPSFPSDRLHKRDKQSIHYNSSNYHTPVLWGKPLEAGTLKIFAIAPRYGSFDFLELEKRLDCSIQLVTTEDSSHLGCDPLWGIWCQEEFKSDAITQKIRNGIKKKWDLIVVAGVQLEILPKEIYESIIDKTAKGTGLLIIPAMSDTSLPPHSVEDFINNLESISEPSERFINLFSGGSSEIITETNNISVTCANHEKGRIVYIKNYLNGVINHALLPEQAVTGEMTYLENAWAGIISLILWCAHLSENIKIVNISDAKPPGPIEEEIPPELPMMVIRNLNQSLLGPGTYPFFIELLRKDKQKMDEIKIQIRRENEYFAYQQYEFKPTIQKRGATFLQVELPVGAGNYFLDIWLLRKGKIVDFFTKRFQFTSWPEIVSIKTDKNFVYPNDSITLRIAVSSNIMEDREGSIIVQGIDNYPIETMIEGNFICEQSKPITGKGGEVDVTLHFADLMGSYLKINIWGAPTRISHLGTMYSMLFSYRSLYIPIQRKIFNKEWSDFIQLNDIREYNQLQIARFWMEIFNCGLYLSVDKYTLPSITHIYQPCIVQFAEEATQSAVNKHFREPCINDEKYINLKKDEITQCMTSSIIPTPFAISLGLNNCLVQTDEWVCFCPDCTNKFRQHVLLEERLQEIPAWIEHFEPVGLEKLEKEISNKNFPAYLSFYKLFMENSLISFETELKNKIKPFFPDTPIGFRYFSGNENIQCRDWIETIHSVDWVILEPDPFAYAISPYIKSQGKSFWVSLDFANPQLTPEKITWNYWSAILNQANGVWLLNVNGDKNHSQPIKLLNDDGTITSELNSVIQIHQQLQHGGIRDLFVQLKPDYNEEVGIYYSPENFFLTYDYPEFSYRNSFVHFTRLLNGFGFNPIIITKENILSNKKLKVLIIPCCLWLSEEEIENISEFLERGYIIADVSPGVISGNELTMNLRDILDLRNIKSKTTKNENLFLFNRFLTKRLEHQPIEEIKNEISFLKNVFQQMDIKSPFLEEDNWIDGKFYSFNNGSFIAWFANLNAININEDTKVSLENNIFRGKRLLELIEKKNIRKININDYKNRPLLLSNLEKDYRAEMEVKCPAVINRGSRIPINIKFSGKNEIKYKAWVYIEIKKDKNDNKPIIRQFFNIETDNKKEIIITNSNNLPPGWYSVLIKEMGMAIEKELYIKII